MLELKAGALDITLLAAHVPVPSVFELCLIYATNSFKLTPAVGGTFHLKII